MLQSSEHLATERPSNVFYIFKNVVAIFQSHAFTLTSLGNEFTHCCASHDFTALSFNVASHGLGQHAAATFGNGLAEVVNAGNHHIKTLGGTKLVRQSLRCHSPA